MHHISEDGNIFILEIPGAATVEIVINALRDAFGQPDYFEKNDIVIFSGEFFEVQMDQLELITNYILEVFPTNSSSRKSAVVVPSGFNQSIVEIWAATASQLPYELKIFSNLRVAKDWVLG